MTIRTKEESGLGVYAGSACVLAVMSIATLAVDRLLAQSVGDSALRLASAFSLVQAVAVTLISLGLLGRRWYASVYANLCEQLRPGIQEQVMALALSGQVWPGAVPRRGAARDVLEQCLAAALVGLRDSGRGRLQEFALSQGFQKQWGRAYTSRSLDQRKRAISLLALISPAESDQTIQAALADPHPAVRTDAMRASMASGSLQSVERIFRSALSDTLLTRILLSGDMKRHARHLLMTTVPELLAESDAHAESNVKAQCLQVLATWKLAIPGLDIMPMLTKSAAGNSGRQHLPLLVSLLPYVLVDDSIEQQLLSALEISDIEVQCAVARAAGQLKLSGLIPSLIRLLNQNARLALAAAQALAQMGAQGERNLRTIVSGTDRKAAAVAMEALETAAVGIC
jgi:HEAT repeat protein